MNRKRQTEGDTLLQDKPMLVEALTPYRIKSIAAGSNHLMAISDDGQLFAWGSGEQGQLGRRVLERHKQLALRPSNVTPRWGRSRLQVQKVVCGSYHTLVFAKVVEGSASTGRLSPMSTPPLPCACYINASSLDQ